MPSANLIGKKILGYTITEKIDSGAFGTVYKAVKKNAAGEYIRAIKHIRIPNEKQYLSVLNSMGGDVSKADNYFEQVLDNIVSEIQILNDLSESGARHIVRYFENDIDVIENPKRYDVYILMELLTPLEDYISQSNEFTVRQVTQLAQDVLKGIASCHDNGIIHRDIKDDNIFVDGKGEFKIGDFGVSKVLKDSSRAASVKGTPNFLAPEVYLGKSGYTKSVDLYSLGIVLYQMLNYGRSPFLPKFPEIYYPDDEDQAFEKRMSGEIPELPSLGGSAIGQVVINAISPNHLRYQSAEEFSKDLREAVLQSEDEILDVNVKLRPIVGQLAPKEPVYNETMAVTQSDSPVEQKAGAEDETEINSSHKDLFVSIAEDSFDEQETAAPVPDENPETVAETEAISTETNGQAEEINISVMAQSDQLKDLSQSPEVTRQKKKLIDKWISQVPLILFGTGFLFQNLIWPGIEYMEERLTSNVSDSFLFAFFDTPLYQLSESLYATEILFRDFDLFLEMREWFVPSIFWLIWVIFWFVWAIYLAVRFIKPRLIQGRWQKEQGKPSRIKTTG